MTTSDEYNGWANRETWALDLWLTNDQGLYEMTRERVRDQLDDPEITDTFRGYETGPEDLQRWRVTRAGDAVRALWEELTDPDGGLMSAEAILEMVRDIGSEYRVDWDEIGAYWLSDLDES